MATVEIFTAARMQAIEDEAIVNAELRDGSGSNKDLVLIRNNLTEINVGNVRGPIGVTPTVPDELQWSYAGGLVNASRPTADSVPLRIKCGSTTPTTGINAEATIAFGSTFNGILSVVAQIGDETTASYTHLNGAALSGTLNTGLLNLTCLDYTTTGFDIKVTVPPVEPAGLGFDLPVGVGGLTTFRVNWIAIGW
jgi:hypothetical protein